jgi:DNA end-binding protein Ku
VAHAIWSGSINFGLVTIPVKLYSATRAAAQIHFHFLHAEDEGRIHNERVCDVCGKKVAWGDLVRGYEYEKGQHVVVSDEELKKANVEATQSVQIVEFVSLSDIDPIYFDTPYYLEPDRKGRHAYALLREALRQAKKVGVARVVLRSREHLAVLRPERRALLVELMHWQDEIVEPGSFDLPEEKENVPAAEMKAAQMLIDAMTTRFDPSEFRDTYRERVQELIEARVAGKPAPKAARAKQPTEVRNLMDVLAKSLDQARADGGAPRAKPPAKARPRPRAHGHAHHGKRSAA